ncbi:MAG: amino acid adenylation domain-containing protein, partial [Sphaerospermopsis kisseleviana]
ADGNIEYIGRIDNQVKIRGFRIELGEIEAVLNQHPQIQTSCVIVREDNPTEKRLVGYIVPKKDTTPELTAIRQFLVNKLPGYMIPSALVILENLPLTPNGKIDRRALPKPELDSTIVEKYVAPRNPIEELLTQTWLQVLKVESVGVNDNFFELGGHSLLATQIVSRIRKIFQVELPLNKLFAAPTVRELAHIITQLQQDKLEQSTPPLSPRAKDADLASDLPMSFAQQRLWFLDQFEANSAVYNIPTALHLRGKLHSYALEQSLQTIIHRHEALRTNFTTIDGQPIQVIREQKAGNKEQGIVSIVDLQHLGKTEQEIAVEQLTQQQMMTGFELETEALIRVQLILVNETEQILLVCMHHIVSDGWSMGVFFQELTQLYNAYCQNQPSPLSTLPIQYSDFAIWQREWLQGDVLQNQITYWEKQLKDAPTLLSLPTDRPRPAVQTFVGDHYKFALAPELSQKLTELSRQEGCTLFMTLLAAYDTLLYRYTGQSDILVGSPIANRDRAEIEGLIGFFVNTLVMRTNLEGNPSFSELLTRVREMSLGAYAHQHLPFEMLVEALQPERNLSHSPLFQVMFVLQNTPISTIELSGLSVNLLEVKSEISKFDLTLAMEESASGLVGVWEYNSDLFDSRTIERMAGNFITLLESIVANPQESIAQLPILTEVEQHQLLIEWNDTQVEYPVDKCIHELFEEQVEKTPNAIAVVFENEQLTYQQLNSRANQLAHYLQSLGVKPETLVGICVERSLEMVIGLLGILKAGGAYVPLDPEYPTERLSFMLEDAQVSVLLTQKSLLNQLPLDNREKPYQVICLEQLVLSEVEVNTFNLELTENPNHQNQPENLAYVIYTSGSTGKPKGVTIEHRAIVNLSLTWAKTFQVQNHSRLLQFGSFSFDLSVGEITTALVTGACLYLGNKVTLLPSQSLVDFLTVNKITHSFLSPSALSVLPKAKLPDLQCITVGGEACTTELVNQWGTERKFYNCYGPTESTVTATIFHCQPNGKKPAIGKAISNIRTYILDKNNQLLPPGIPGELCIAGVGLARGYLNRPQATGEKFIEIDINGQVERIYKTGDLARYLADGNIEYLGRIDNQVKIRGFRIELGEIEAVLNQHPQIQTSCVIVREDNPGQKQLVSYLIPHQHSTVTMSEMRQYLKETLPEYMVPHSFVTLETLPITPNGKIDRRALPAPETRTGLEIKIVPPRNQTEKILAQIWAEVLRTKQIGINDNFFELGGDSILSIQILAKAKQAGLQLTAKQLFANQTIAELAAIAPNIKTIEIEQELVTGKLPLTPIQHWFFEQNFTQPHHFNQAFLLSVPSDIKPEPLKQAFQQLLTHHDALRLSFSQKNSNWEQTYTAPKDQIAFREIDLSTIPEHKQPEAIEAQGNLLQANLDISENLIQVALFHLGRGKRARLQITIHHLAIDGVSWRILLEDLQTAYQQLEQGKIIQLPAKTTSFKDWSEKLTAYAQSQTLKSEAAYWLNETRAAVPSISVDHTKGENTVAAANTVLLSLSEAETHALLQEVPKAYNTQINDVLLTALALVLSKWTNSKNVLFNLEGHGREDIVDSVDLSRTIGWFTTIFPVVVELPTTENLGETLKTVKEQLRAIPNKGIGYGLLRYLSQDPEIASQLKTLPQAEISFNYLGQFDQQINTTSWMQPASESAGRMHGLQNNRPHLLDINSMIVEKQLQIEWTYSTNFHQAATIEKLAQEFVNTLQDIITHCASGKNGGYTPSDFPLVKLNQVELDQLLASLDTCVERSRNKTNKTNWRNIENIYPLSPMQQGMLFESLYAPDSQVYFEQSIYNLSGQLNLRAFEKAWQQVVARHSILRTAFIWEQLAEPVQIVYRQVDVKIESEDWQHLSTQAAQEKLEVLVQSQRKQGFQLSTAPLMQLSVIQLSADSYQFVWNFHHLLLDGWSVPLLFQDLLYFYQAIIKGENPTLPAVLSYDKYIAWLQQQDLSKAEEFWREKLQGFTAPTPLTVDKLSSKGKQLDSSYREQKIQLTREETSRLQTFTRKHQLTMNNLVQGVWSLLLSRYSQESDVVFGATVSGRPPSLIGVESMVGLFINSLPVRVKTCAETEVLALLKELQIQQVESEQYSYSSLADIQRLSDVPGGSSLFESLVVFENYPVSEAAEKNNYGFSIDSVQGIEQTNYPLTVGVIPGQELLVIISYDTSRFDDAAICRLLGHFQTLLSGIVADPQQRISQLPILTETEQHQLLVEWNDTQVEYPVDKCIHELFEEQVEKTPNAIAVVFENEQLTYQQLNSRANQLAHHLQSLGV